MFGLFETKVPEVSLEVVKDAVESNKKCIILDVRTTGEVARGKISGSINLPVEKIVSEILTKVKDKNTLIYVYCLTGSRSKYAVDAMIKLGYTNVFNMEYGMLGWRAKYFPES